jgi:2-keto-4-pentenoate hydratase
MRMAFVAAAAKQLAAARSTGLALEGFAAGDEPNSAEESYAIQNAVAALVGAIGGWKLAVYAPGQPLRFAPIFSATIADHPACMSGKSLRMIGVEAEVALRVAMDLPAGRVPRTRTAALQCLASIHPAIEVVDTRFANFRAVSPLSVLADNQNSGALIVGSAIEGLEDLQTPGFSMFCDGVLVGGPERNPVGDPIELFIQLADHCAARGLMLRAGTVVTTGSCSGIAFVTPGASVEVRLDDRVLVSCAFTLDGVTRCTG